MMIENKLERDNIETLIRLTGLQQGLLFHYLQEDSNEQYHEQLSLNIGGELDINLLQRALDKVINDNEMLRTVYRWKGIDKPVQVTLKKTEVCIKYKELLNDNWAEELEILKKEDMRCRLDLENETIRVYLCKLQENSFQLIISNHHILYDGWSNAIIIKELMENYNCLYFGHTCANRKKTKYSEFIKYLNEKDEQKEKDFWVRYIDGYENNSSYFINKNIGENREISYEIKNNLWDRILQFAKENKIRISSILYGAWGILLQKLNNSEDVFLGTTVSGRPESINNIDNMVGLFINTIPLRIKTKHDESLFDFIVQLNKRLSERGEYENTSLSDINKYCKIKKDEELFDSIVALENYPMDFTNNETNVLAIKDFEIRERTNYNIALEILILDTVKLKFNYNSAAVEEYLVDKFGSYMERIIEYLVSNPNIKMENIELLSSTEREQIIHIFNNTKKDYEHDSTIHKLFELQAEKNPNQIALKTGDREITYGQLNESANSLAMVLRKNNVNTDVVVALMSERCPEMIIAILGILKAGGAYLPLDPSQPKTRAEYILKDSHCKLMLCSEKYKNNVDFKGTVLTLEDETLFVGKKDNLNHLNCSKDLAYVIYTSGTAGNPKGVMVEHRSLHNFVQSFKRQFKKGFNSTDNVLSLTNYVFDVSVCEFFTSLTSGSTLVINESHKTFDTTEIAKLIIEQDITFTYIPPSLLNWVFEKLIEDKHKLKLNKLLVGVEPIKSKVLKQFRELNNQMEIINGYGPTESTICSTFYNFSGNEDGEATVAIGRPIDNTQIYIMTGNTIVPIGFRGELCIAGDGLSRGYMNNLELSNEKFIDNPFKEGIKLYRTGDLARWKPDGNIEFIGRVDNQVKIRGFRIELGEIESALNQYSNIKECFVTVNKDAEDNKYLCAYAIASGELSPNKLKDFLHLKLPEYMIPQYFVQMDSFPLTPNGKLDKKHLPKPEIDMIDNTKYRAPANDTEAKLVDIWSEVLGVKKETLSTAHNFFEIGGQSLKATALSSKIFKELKQELPLKEIFRSPTIKGMSEYLRNTTDQNINIDDKLIHPVEEQEDYNISHAQRRLWIMDRFEEGKTSYNIPAAFIMEGELNWNAFQKTYQFIVERHESLRTIFITRNGVPKQKILPHINTQIEKLEAKNKDLLEIVKENANYIFDLTKGPLIRMAVVPIDIDKYLLLFNVHHIVSDGWSVNVFIKEFMNYYNAFKKGNEPNVKPMLFHYKDYSVWQLKNLENGNFDRFRKYWLEKLSGNLPVLNFPSDRPRPTNKTFNGDNIYFQIPKESKDSLLKLCGEYNVSIFILLHAIVKILLYRYTGQKDIIVGSPMADRVNEELRDQIGFYVNTIAVRDQVEGEISFEDFLNNVKRTCVEAIDNQQYPFDRLVEDLELKRDLSHSPVFDVMLILQNNDVMSMELDNLIIETFSVDNKVSKFDLTYSFTESESGLDSYIEYNTDLYDKERIERMVTHFMMILSEVISNPKIKIKDINILPQKESTILFEQFNNTNAKFSDNETIVSLFEKQVERTPEALAVISNGVSLTYRELNQSANIVANYLRNTYEVMSDDRIGVMLQRSEKMIVAIMGIVKAGGAYVPIDPNYPEERIEYILEDSGCSVVLSDKNEGVFIHIDEVLQQKVSKENPTHWTEPSNLAYVIYTSGSTGNPKGTLLEHRALINRIEWMQKAYPIGEQDTILQKTTYTFDVSVWEIFWWSLYGAKVCMLEPGGEKDPEIIVNAIQQNNITTIHFVPSMFQLFLEYVEMYECSERIKSLNYIFASGEALMRNHVERWGALIEKNGTRLINLYGPTEAAIDVTYYNCDKSDLIIPIGKPIDNINLYIVDEEQNPVPIGVAGELCISGVGLARGYLNKPELTERSFVKNPFQSGQRMYKTGDIARWMSDGNIEYLGRKDYQVKIRGFRIELGEIDYNLKKIEGVKDCITIDFQDVKGEKQLCSYIATDRELETSMLKKELSKKLSAYMVPMYFIYLEKLPLTSNGKVDRKALERPKERETEKDVGPRNELEEKLIGYMSEILGHDNIGIYDDFFEIGGHSLRAMQLIFRIKKELGIEIKLNEVFKYSTIAELVEVIQDKKEELGKNGEYGIDLISSQIQKVEKQLNYEISNAQKRLWILAQMAEENSASYNIPAAFILEGHFDKVAFGKAYQFILERHESLRTAFVIEEGIPRQKILSHTDNYINYITVHEDIDVDKQVRELVRKNASISFELENGSLIQMSVVTITKKKHILLFNMHHIISDGWSINVFIKELLMFYDSYKNGMRPIIEPLQIQYKDYVAWHKSQLEARDSDIIKDYWHEKLKMPLPVLDLPTDYIRPTIKTFNGSEEKFNITADMRDRLLKFSRNYNVSLFMLLQATVKILLHRYTGQEDIILGSPTAGRLHKDLDNQIGFYVNTLVFRDYVIGDMSFADFMATVRATCMEAIDNQIYPFDYLVDELVKERDLSRSPIFDAMLVLQNQDKVLIELDDLKVSNYEFTNEVSKFDLTFVFTETESGIEFYIEYNTDLFYKDRIKRMIEHLMNILSQIVENPQVKIKDINLLSSKETTVLLEQFNNTQAIFSDNDTIVSLFEKQVERTPEALAVISNGVSLTYRELNQSANIVANYLRNTYEVMSDDRIGVMLQRSEKMIVAIMGIVKAGGAYVPIDPNYPEERIEYILEDSGCSVVLSDKNEGVFIHIDEVLQQKVSKENPTHWTEPSNLAYVIYTSGSTGNPKGTLLEHRALINRIEWMQKAYPIGEQDTILQKTTYTFDVSVWEIFWWSLYGAKVCMLEPGGEKDPEIIVNAIQQNNITTIHFVPSMFQLFLEYVEMYECSERIKSLNYIFASGEALMRNHVERWGALIEKNGTRLINLYGPTEAAIDVTYYNCDKSDLIIPIGKPIDNINLYIVDEEQNPVPIGVAGELCISGVGLARGYLNKPELTERSFVKNPFQSGQRMYKTGDIARWMSDGNIEYLGRKDYQVKIRGFRIELGEIDYNLKKIEGVKDCITIDFQDAKGEKQLCSYIATDSKLDTAVLRKELSKKLAAYMMPMYFEYLEELPLSNNGKVDRKALKRPNETEWKPGIKPRNELEANLLGYMSEILGHEEIGVFDNFFDIGGHSLRAMQLALKIKKQLGKDISLSEVFLYPTIAQMAEYIVEKKEELWIDESSQSEQRDHYPLSSAQKRLFFLHAMDPNTTVYNMPAAISLEGDVSREQLESAFEKLVIRHDSLRTSFELREGEPIQKVKNHLDIKLEYEEIEQENDSRVQAFFRPFDLTKAPLIRMGLFKITDNKFILTIDMHHIISDGVSMSVMIEEFGRILKGEKLPVLSTSYIDYTLWLELYSNSKMSQIAKKFWLKQFEDGVPILNLPIDYQRPLLQSFQGDAVDLRIDAKRTKQLRELAKDNDATLFMVLLSACNIMFSKLCSQEDIVIGTPVSGRLHPDHLRTVGVFLNSIALRNKVNPELSYVQFLSEVRANTLKALDYQGYQFENLVEQVVHTRNTSRNPLFDVMFALNNMEANQLDIPFIKVEPFEITNESSKLDLKITAIEIGNEIVVNFRFNTNLFEKATIELFTSYFENILHTLGNQVMISKIGLMSLEDENRLLEDFNQELKINKDYIFQKALNHALNEHENNIALSSGERKITYGELNKRSNCVASWLSNNDYAKGTIVSVAIVDRVEFIIALIGVLKAGCIFVPFDYNQKKEMIKDIIDEIGVPVIITDDNFALDKLNHIAVNNMYVVHLDEIENNGETCRCDILPEIYYEADDMVYIYYTSGTTGKPKMIAGKSESLLHFIEWEIKEFDIDESYRFSQLTRPTFDPYLRDIFVPLLSGGTICIPAEDEIYLNSMKLVKWLESEEINLIHTVPSLFRIIQEQKLTEESFKNLKYILLAGEKLYPSYLEHWYGIFSDRIQLVNIYGPTETTMGKFFKRINKSDTERSSISVGKPIEGATAIILNKERKPCGAMETGELYIRTPYRSLGYYRNEKLNASYFILNPFTDDSSDIIYRTGDLAMKTKDGEFVILGRTDRQVKIRGQRLELEDVEGYLNSIDYIKEAIVITKEKDNKEQYLCAYYTVHNGENSNNIKNHFRNIVPDYMVPSYFMQMEKLPLNANGKLDITRLPEPEYVDESNFVPARNEIDQVLIDIWADLLDINKDKVSITNNFFENGGNSLIIMSFHSKICTRLELGDMPVASLFQYPSIQQFSDYLNKRNVEQKISDGVYEEALQTRMSGLKLFGNRND